VTRALIDLQALSIGIGAAAFAVFFWAVAVVCLIDGALTKVVGYASILAAVASLLGLVTVFTDSGVFAADGAFGFWVRYGVFVGWLVLASLFLMDRAGSSRRR
jgi:hypothetical protein